MIYALIEIDEYNLPSTLTFHLSNFFQEVISTPIYCDEESSTYAILANSVDSLNKFIDSHGLASDIKLTHVFENSDAAFDSMLSAAGYSVKYMLNVERMKGYGEVV